MNNAHANRCLETKARVLNISPRCLQVHDGMRIFPVIHADEDKGHQLKNGKVSAKWLRENTRVVRSHRDG